MTVAIAGCGSTQQPVFTPGGSLGLSSLKKTRSASYPQSEAYHDSLLAHEVRTSDRTTGDLAAELESQRNFGAAGPRSTAAAPRSQALDSLAQQTKDWGVSRPLSSLQPLQTPSEESLSQAIVRAQSNDGWTSGNSSYPNAGRPYNNAAPIGTTASQDSYGGSQTGFQEVIPGADNRVQVPPYAGDAPLLPGNVEPYPRGPFGNPGYIPGEPVDEVGLPQNFADVDVFVQEAQSGRFMIGAGFNSDAGVTGQLIIDERNFDYKKYPRSVGDFVNGQAFRGAGQGFRLEAMPGSEVQRYLVSFSEPYLPYTQISMNVSGYYYDRAFFDWNERRLGGRVAFGYRLTPDLSVTAATRMEQVKISDPRVSTSPELNATLGTSDLFIGQLSLTHDTRDHPFAPTEGHLVELTYSQAFGTYDYPRGDLDYRRYFLVRERPDGSGRHTLSFSTQLGVTGAQTPIFENYFAGGVSSLRGFDFRGASPVSGGVRVGGQFRWINSVEYLFPVTADDMIKGVVFCDFGTVESDVRLDADTFRVAPGFGVRVAIPNFGGAPLAFDFAFPVNRADTDDTRVFSFFMGLLR